MKIPYSWLAEYVDLHDVPPARVAELLTLRTCEVDAVHHIGAGLDNILIGEVVEAEKHPNADSLKITKVNVGRGELFPIVCGAPNVAKGQKVAVITPGSRLPNGMEITERKMRGEISRGMICSERELGLGDEHDGILVLEPEAEVGRKLTSLPSIEDWIIEIDNKSVNHRPDLWGVYGFARELSVILQKPLLPLPAASLDMAGGAGAFPVTVSDNARCFRYLAAVFTNLQTGDAPAWMRRRLRLCGARPIRNIVDITNYVMFETGQPTHAFDRGRLRGGRIDVRAARDGETLVTLDNQTRKLVSTDLVIANGEGATGLAGVMGGAASEVGNATNEIVLESAAFDAPTVRRTAARLGLRSEASTRFEKSLDPGFADLAMARIAQLLQSGAAGPNVTIAGPVTVAGARAAQTRTIAFSWSYVAERLGVDAAGMASGRASWEKILTSLGIQLTQGKTPDECTAVVPSFRATKDLTEPIDLVEEIARLRGYENVIPRPLSATVQPPPAQSARRALIRLVEDRLVALGFRGLESYSFLADSLIEQLGIGGSAFVTLKNSIVADQSRMRREVMPSLLALVTKNISVEQDLRLFEIGKGYRPDHARTDSFIGADPREPQEIHSAAGIVALPPKDTKAGAEKVKFNDGIFLRARGFVVSLLECASLKAEFVDANAVAPGRSFAPAVPYLHPKRRLLIGATVAGQHRLLGYLGEIHPETAGRLGLEGVQVAGFELDLSALEAAWAAAGARRFVPIPRFPGITVDVALAAPENLSAEALESLVRSADDKLCAGIELFDIYAGAELGSGKRSVAFHVELRSPDRTLTDADEAAFLKNVAARASAAGAQLRGWQG